MTPQIKPFGEVPGPPHIQQGNFSSNAFRNLEIKRSLCPLKPGPFHRVPGDSPQLTAILDIPPSLVRNISISVAKRILYTII